MLGANYVVIPAVIPINTAVSPTLDLSGYCLVGIETPAAWTAAGLTFQASGSAAAAVADVYDNGGSEYTVSAAAAHYVIMSPADVLGWKYLVVRSGTAGTPVNQAGERTLNLICRSLE